MEMHYPIDHCFDEAFVDALARQEAFNKHLYRPNSYLHKWWARRCGTTFRAILKHLIADPQQRDFHAPGGLEGQIILDPMMGGGTTLHEAIRLGANVIGADIDALPVLQARATLHWLDPQTLQDGFDQLYGRLQDELGDWFLTTCPDCGTACPLRFVLYGVRRRCGCGEALFLDSLVLRHERDGSLWTIGPQDGVIRHGERLVSRPKNRPILPIHPRSHTRCTACGLPYREDRSRPWYQRYEPVAIAGRCPHHRFFFTAPQAADLALIDRAEALRETLPLAAARFVPADGPKSADLRRRGVSSYLDFYTGRQLLWFSHAINALRRLDHPARLKLALLISTSAEFNALLCGYKGNLKSRPGAIRHVFSHHAYTWPVTALENNPLHPSRASGTLRGLFEARLLRAARWAQQPLERRQTADGWQPVPIVGERDAGEEVQAVSDLASGRGRFLLLHGSSARLPLPDQSVDHIVTDPPYYNSVQYGDLAAFFRGWLRHLLPEDGVWESADYPLSAAAIDQHSGESDQYETVLGQIFSECRRLLRPPGGRLIFTFHHRDARGWAALTGALRRAGFRLVARYVIHAEHPGSVHITNQRALWHDVILVLAVRAESAEPSPWTRPEPVSADLSHAFCAACGTLLGHLLDHPDLPALPAWQTFTRDNPCPDKTELSHGSNG
jgi:putative DNA methylase